MNTDAPWPTADAAGRRVLKIQTKLHRWAIDDPDRRFDDLFNLVDDPAFLVVAWERVRGNRGARTAGVDGDRTTLDRRSGRRTFLAELRDDLKARTVRSVARAGADDPEGRRQAPPAGHPDRRDRVVQAALKLVLEPIFEADFQPCSLRFPPETPGPGRDRRDPLPDQRPAPTSGCWRGTSTACFDEIDHSALMGRVRRRIGDKRVLALVKAFLKAGILGEDGVRRDTDTGTPQGGHPVAAAGQHRAVRPRRALRRGVGRRWATHTRAPTARRKGDGQLPPRPLRGRLRRGRPRRPSHAEALRDEVAAVLAPMGCGCRKRRRGSSTSTRASTSSGSASSGTASEARPNAFVYTYPSKKSLAAVKAKVRTLTRQGTQPTARRPAAPAQPGAAGLDQLLPARRVQGDLRLPARLHLAAGGRWLRRKHPDANWKWLRRRYLPRWWPTDGDVTLFDPAKVRSPATATGATSPHAVERPRPIA